MSDGAHEANEANGASEFGAGDLYEVNVWAKEGEFLDAAKVAEAIGRFPPGAQVWVEGEAPHLGEFNVVVTGVYGHPRGLCPEPLVRVQWDADGEEDWELVDRAERRDGLAALDQAIAHARDEALDTWLVEKLEEARRALGVRVTP